MSRALAVAAGFGEVEQELETGLGTGAYAWECPSECEESICPTVYNFRDFAIARVHAYCWSFTIRIKRIIRSIDVTADPDPTNREILKLCHRIWMCYEYSWKRRPVGTLFIHTTLMATIDFASEEVQEWIAQRLTAMDEYKHGKEANVITKEEIIFHDRILRGDLFVQLCSASDAT